jgi:hypothetical protein
MGMPFFEKSIIYQSIKKCARTQLTSTIPGASTGRSLEGIVFLHADRLFEAGSLRYNGLDVSKRPG